MLTTLEAVVARLVDGYSPERIILFGSRGHGYGRPDSDFDVLILKDTPLRPAERRAEVEWLLADRRIPLDLIVYTPDEFRRLYSEGSPFVLGAASRRTQ